MFEAGTAGVAAADRQKLLEIRGNRRWRLPLHFAVIDRTEADWVALRDALSAERFATEAGEEVDPEAAAVLQAARSDPAVALAGGYIEANLAQITVAWTEAVGL